MRVRLMKNTFEPGNKVTFELLLGVKLFQKPMKTLQNVEQTLH